MKKKLLTSFADWYIVNKEGKTSNYVSKIFSDDRDVFIENLSEIAAEYAIGYGYNPFIIDSNNFKKAIKQIDLDLGSKKSDSFEVYNDKNGHGVPKALLGRKNYLDFLSQLIDDNKARVIKPKQQSFIKYTSEELFKNFRFRLITQDRLYNELYFPISILKKLFYQQDRKFFDTWIKKQVDTIQVFTSNGVINFSEIEELWLSKENVHAKLYSQDEVILHTPIAGKSETEPFVVNDLNNIAIVHVTPFKELYMSHLSGFNELKKIHIGIIIYNDGEDVKNRSDLGAVGNYFLNSVYCDDINITALKQELQVISDSMELQLMDSQQNLYKKKFN